MLEAADGRLVGIEVKAAETVHRNDSGKPHATARDEIAAPRTRSLTEMLLPTTTGEGRVVDGLWTWAFTDVLVYARRSVRSCEPKPT